MATYGSVSNFNAIETTSAVTVGGGLSVTGAISATSNITASASLVGEGATITGNVTVTGDFKLTDAANAVTGTTLGDSLNYITNTGFSSISSTSGALKRALLSDPVAGARKELLFIGDTASSSQVTVLACTTSTLTTYFGANTSQTQLQMGVASKILVSLIGNSTSQWLIVNISTLNNNTTGTVIPFSSNT